MRKSPSEPKGSRHSYRTDAWWLLSFKEMAKEQIRRQCRRKAGGLGKDKGKTNHFKANPGRRFGNEGKKWIPVYRRQVLRSLGTGLSVATYFTGRNWAQENQSPSAVRIQQNEPESMRISTCSWMQFLYTRNIRKKRQHVISSHSDFAFGFQNKYFESEPLLVLTERV